MAVVQDKTFELFTRAGLADDGLGYPNDVAFLPGDQDVGRHPLGRMRELAHAA